MVPCAVERIPLNQKVKLLCKYVRFLGMINGNGLVIPCPEKVQAIAYLTRPSNVKELQSFLGAVNWFRRHRNGGHNGKKSFDTVSHIERLYGRIGQSVLYLPVDLSMRAECMHEK